MNINELKELVKHCVYIEKGITCMSDTYYNDMIKTIENLQSKKDKAIEYMYEVLECNYHGANITFDDLIHNTENILKED